MAIALLMGLFAEETFAQKKENKTVCFKSNMDCGECEKTVYEYLKFEKGVKDLKVDYASNTIMVEYKAGKNTDENLASAIGKKGYKADKISKEEYEKIVAQGKEQGQEHEQ